MDAQSAAVEGTAIPVSPAVLGRDAEEGVAEVKKCTSQAIASIEQSLTILNTFDVLDERERYISRLKYLAGVSQ